MKKNIFCSNPLTKIQPDLIKLEKEIVGVVKKPNKIEGIVELFRVISPLHDENPFASTILKLQKKGKKYAKELEALTTLQKHFINAGRSEYGLNRTQKGEEVTADKVFLGNVFGLFTKTASYWLANKEKLQNESRPDASKNPESPVSNWYLINDHQAGNFIKSHVDGILQQIAILKVA